MLIIERLERLESPHISNHQIKKNITACEIVNLSSGFGPILLEVPKNVLSNLEKDEKNY
jgi:hypothetical protein